MIHEKLDKLHGTEAQREERSSPMASKAKAHATPEEVALENSTATELAEDTDSRLHEFYEVTAHGFYPIAFRDIKPETRFVAIPRAVQGEIQAMVSHIASQAPKRKLKKGHESVDGREFFLAFLASLYITCGVGLTILFADTVGSFADLSVYLFSSPLYLVAALATLNLGQVITRKSRNKKLKKLFSPLSDRLEKEQVKVMTLDSFKSMDGRVFTVGRPSAEQLIRAKELLQERIDDPQAKIEKINEEIKKIVESEFHESEDAQFLVLRKQKQTELEKAHELDSEIASILSNETLTVTEESDRL